MIMHSRSLRVSLEYFLNYPHPVSRINTTKDFIVSFFQAKYIECVCLERCLHKLATRITLFLSSGTALLFNKILEIAVSDSI